MSSSTLYTVQPSPGEGLGCFSTTCIPAGTLILSEKPLFRVLEPRTNASVTTAFSHLTSPQQAQYLTLHASALGPDPDSIAARIISIFNTNAWATESYTSILPLAARFNHSCIPNASFAWNARLARITVHAIVPIPAGAQITLSYELPYQTRAVRREKLASYGFVCKCSACGGCGEGGGEGDGDGSSASDVRRARMMVLHSRIRFAGKKQKWTSPSPSPTPIPKPRAALELIALLKSEGLVGEALGLAYHEAAAGWRRCGRLDLAVRYAACELEVCIRCFGVGSPNVDTSKAFLGGLRRELESVGVGGGDT